MVLAMNEAILVVEQIQREAMVEERRRMPEAVLVVMREMGEEELVKDSLVEAMQNGNAIVKERRAEIEKQDRGG